jgi:hypothetical protein
MATGHINPGYSKIVSRNKSALNNSEGRQPMPDYNLNELEMIKARAKAMWSVEDRSSNC